MFLRGKLFSADGNYRAAEAFRPFPNKGRPNLRNPLVVRMVDRVTARGITGNGYSPNAVEIWVNSPASPTYMMG